MKLSLFSDYSLRVLMFAGLKNEVFQLSEVAETYNISRHHLGQVVHSLAKLGYLQTRRGRGGGMQLALNPEQIRLGKLIRETEDQPVIVECFDLATNSCKLNGSCRLKGILAEAMGSFYRHLDQFTLADLLTGRNRQRMIKSLQMDMR